MTSTLCCLALCVLFTFGGPWLLSKAEQQSQLRIPLILHQILVDDRNVLDSASDKAVYPPLNWQWHHSCQKRHPHWKHKLWNLDEGEALLHERYSWFLPTFQAYGRNISKCDALRPFLIHAFGGLYLDFDVECFKPSDELLAGYDLVFQSSERDGLDITNAAMASIPGHPFWLDVMALLKHRAHLSSTNKNEAHAILASTGPQLLSEAFWSYVGLPEQQTRTTGQWNISGTFMHVYGLGSWFVPCFWNDYRCHLTIDKLSQQQPPALPELLVGHHHCAATWLKPIKDRNRRHTFVLIVQCGVAFGVAAGCMFWCWPRGARQAIVVAKRQAFRLRP